MRSHRLHVDWEHHNNCTDISCLPTAARQDTLWSLPFLRAGLPKQSPESLNQSKTLGEKQLHRRSHLHLWEDTQCLRYPQYCVQPLANTRYFTASEKVDDAVTCSAFIPLQFFPPACEGQGPLLHAIKNSVFTPPQYTLLINSTYYKKTALW